MGRQLGLCAQCEVVGAKTDEDAEAMAKAVVGSSLVKSAVYGRDPNWGRIAAAVGYSGLTNWDQNDMCVKLVSLFALGVGCSLWLTRCLPGERWCRSVGESEATRLSRCLLPKR
jgi:hypothetical protein